MPCIQRFLHLFDHFFRLFCKYLWIQGMNDRETKQMPNAFGLCEIIYKVQKEENIFWGESWFPLQNARTRARLLYHIGEV